MIDAMYYFCSDVESWGFKMSVVKNPVKQDIRIHWWELVV